jgi:hypothetical protein
MSRLKRTSRKLKSIGFTRCCSTFFRWHKTDNSGMMPAPSNAQWFWMGIIALTCITIKTLQELDLIGVWVIS